MSITLAHWIVGPQVVGLIMIIVGCIQKYYPPKRINDLYGYRTDASKKNQQTWDEANRYSAMLMIKIGFIAIIGGLILTQLVPLKYEWIMAISTTFTGIGFAVVLMVKTEKHLENKFDNNGNEIL